MLSVAAGSLARVMVGTEDTRLVVLRRNSASGKSSVAAGIREKFDRGLALVGQVYRPERLGTRLAGGSPLSAVCPR